jgi:hypothetical protein
MRNPDLVRASFPNATRTGIHEAAHAVIGTVRGLHVVFAEIDHGLNPSFRGTTRFRGPTIGPVGDVIIMLLAAAEAERVAFGMVRDGADSEDLRMAREELARVFTVSPSDPMVESAVAELRAMAKADVLEHWDLILTVTAELRRRRVLDAEAIARLCVVTATTEGSLPS